MGKFLIGGGFLLLLPGVFWYLSQPDIPRAILEARYAGAPSQFVMLPNGTRAHVRDRGPRDALALVLIHGSNASLYTWEPWAKQLSDRFRIITVDLPGHGLTGAVPNRDYTQEGMVKFIPPRKIGRDLGKPALNLAGGLHETRYTTLPRPLVRFHDAPIVTGSRLFRLCFEQARDEIDGRRESVIRVGGRNGGAHRNAGWRRNAVLPSSRNAAVCR